MRSADQTSMRLCTEVIMRTVSLLAHLPGQRNQVQDRLQVCVEVT